MPSALTLRHPQPTHATTSFQHPSVPALPFRLLSSPFVASRSIQCPVVVLVTEQHTTLQVSPTSTTLTKMTYCLPLSTSMARPHRSSLRQNYGCCELQYIITGFCDHLGPPSPLFVLHHIPQGTTTTTATSSPRCVPSRHIRRRPSRATLHRRRSPCS